MAFDLKAATPDTSFGSGAFIFGADSQAAASPSIYSESVIWTYWKSLANTWSAAGGSSAPAAYYTGAVYTAGNGTTNFPLVFIQPTGATASSTWSTAGTAFGANMPAGFTGNYFDFALAGASVLKATSAGALTAASITVGNGLDSAPSINMGSNTGFHSSGSTYIGISGNGVLQGYFQTGIGLHLDVVSTYNVYLPAGGSLIFNGDTYIRRLSGASASIAFGAADSASPVAQSTTVQSVVAGTSNIAGADWTIKGSRGTGTAAGGKLIFQTAPAGATGTSQNTLVPGITITAPAQRGGVTQQPSIVLGNAALATADTDGYVYIPTCAGTPTGVPTANTGRVALVYDTTAHQFWIYDGGWLQPKTPAGAAIVTWQ